MIVPLNQLLRMSKWGIFLLQTPAGWGINGLDETAAERCYNKARQQLNVGPMPAPLRTSLLDPFLQAHVKLGLEQISESQVRDVSLGGLNSDLAHLRHTCPVHTYALDHAVSAAGWHSRHIYRQVLGGWCGRKQPRAAYGLCTCVSGTTACV